MYAIAADDVAWSVCLCVSVCLFVCLSVCLSVCLLVTFVSPAQTAEPIKMPWVLLQVGKMM